MNLQGALRRIPPRLSRPVIWGTGLGILLVAMALSFFSQELARLTVMGRGLLALRMLISLILLLGFSPLAWQWGAREGRLTKVARALGQASVLQVLGFSLEWILGNDRPLGNPAWSPAGRILGLGVNALIFTGVGLVIARRELLRDQAVEAERRAREAQSVQLQSQLSPHALLNVLNGLAGLAREDPPKAVQGMRDLAELYRLLLRLGSLSRIHLGEERDLLRHYLAVEAMRLEDLLWIEWDWDSAVDELPVPPLLVQPLVENAIKHGIAPNQGGGRLRIEARPFGDGIRVQVSNTGLAPACPAGSSGLGLPNLVARLALAYGSKATFQLLREEPWTRATLMILGGS